MRNHHQKYNMRHFWLGLYTEYRILGKCATKRLSRLFWCSYGKSTIRLARHSGFQAPAILYLPVFIKVVLGFCYPKPIVSLVCFGNHHHYHFVRKLALSRPTPAVNLAALRGVVYHRLVSSSSC